MSLLSKDLVKAAVESAGLSAISDEVAGAIAADAEYRVRQILLVCKLLFVTLI